MSATSVNFSEISVLERYKLLIGSIVPRPIAWVSTISKSGLTNLAPFSFFNGVCSNPASLLFCPVNHADGREKDTLRNIRATKEFVVNIASVDLIEAVNQTSADYPSEVSEFEKLGINATPSTQVKPPRVSLAPIAFECRLLKIVAVGAAKAPGAGHVVIGEILEGHFKDGVLKDGKIILENLNPLSRLGGAFYGKELSTIELKRPKLTP